MTFRKQRRFRVCVILIMLAMIGTYASVSGATGDPALLKALSRVHIFASLTDDELHALQSAATLHHMKTGECLTKPDMTINSMFIVLDGQADVFRKDMLVATLSGQFLIGETEFLVQLPTFVDVIITKETDVIKVRNAALNDLMERYPRLGFAIMSEFAKIEAQRLRTTTIEETARAENADTAAIDKVRVDFNDAYNRGNAQALAALLDHHAVWLPPGEPSVVGRETIEARYAKFFTKIHSTFELHAGDLRACGEYAFLSGAWRRTDKAKADGVVKKVSGHYLWVLRKQQDGSWKVTRDIWNEVP